MLAGVTIIEVEALGPAPFAGRMLAELGADVIVIHRKDDGHSPAKSAQSPLDAGKRSISLNLKETADVAIARDLIAAADAVIEGFRPGVMEKLGLGPDVVMRDNPALVFGRMTGWGQSGPLSHVAGHDLNYIALSGALHYAGTPDAIPQTPATVVGDIGGGALYLVAGVLSGLIQAMKTGVGTVVDAAIVDGSAHMMNLVMSLQSIGGVSMQRGQSFLDGPHWSRVYRCADGRYISVQCIEPQFYALFLTVMDLGADDDFARPYDTSQWPKACARLTEMFAQHHQDHWAALFDGTNACVAPVLSPDRAAMHPHVAARGIWENTDGVLSAAPAPRFSNYDAPHGQIPHRDGDRDAILAWAAAAKGR